MLPTLRDRIRSTASAEQFHKWKCLAFNLFALFALSQGGVAQGVERDEELLAEHAARRLAAEFSLAQAGGSDLSKIRGVRTAIEELRRGIPGRGPYASLIFRVRDLPEETTKLAANYLSFDRRILRFRPPIDYSAAWGSGIAPVDKLGAKLSLSRLLAERSAESYARVFDAAKAAAANLSAAKDVDSAMRLLEAGINGQGAHANTQFQISPIRKNVRFQAKRLLYFYNGHLHFVPDGDRKEADQILAEIESDRPAQLAQQIVALYATAKEADADFGTAVTPRQIIGALRTGVHASTNLGMQYFRISATASERDWDRAVAYLIYRDSTLTYVPPK